ncbi:hypothetical protein ACLM5H_15045 [Fredinandcohnia humi]
MKVYILFIFSFIVLSSCSTNKPLPQTISESDDKQIIFFSDEDNLQNESNYYDALLELRNKYPTEIANMKIISSDESRLYAKYDIDKYPSLLIVQKSKVIKKIEGVVEVEEIIPPIEEALSHAN